MRVLDRRTSRTSAQAGRSSAPLLTAATAQHRPSTPAISRGRGLGLVRRPADAAAARRRAAARRARVLFSLLVCGVASWGAVALPEVPWWAAVPATVLIVLDLAALVVAGRARASARRTAARQAAMRVAASQRVLSRAAARERVRREAGPVVAAPTSTAIDVRTVALPEVQVDGAMGDTWTPVPVPRPTYMLKPVVPRPEPPPLEEPVASVAAAPVVAAVPDLATEPEPTAPRPWEVDHTWADDLDVVLARRRAVNG